MADVDFILEYSNRAVASFGEVNTSPRFLSICVENKTHIVDRSTNTHTQPLSYIPQWDLACHILSQLLEAVLIREPFTLSLCCSHPPLTPTIFSYQPKTSVLEREEWKLLHSLTQSGQPTADQPSASIVDNAHKLKDVLNCFQVGISSIHVRLWVH